MRNENVIETDLACSSGPEMDPCVDREIWEIVRIFKKSSAGEPQRNHVGALRFHFFVMLNARILLAVFEPSLVYSMPSLVAQMVPM
jgi:hypothetical protein